MTNWKNYFIKQKNRKVREQLMRAFLYCNKKLNALDLGSGNFIESKFLAKKGFRVTAIDNSIDAIKYTKNLDKRINFQNISFQDYDYPKNTFDLINAQFALPFYGEKDFTTFVSKIIVSLKPQGILVGQFFGKKDSWSKSKTNIAFHTKKQVIDLLSGMEILEFIEEEKDGTTASGGLKHWHIFHIIARKI